MTSRPAIHLVLLAVPVFASCHVVTSGGTGSSSQPGAPQAAPEGAPAGGGEGSDVFPMPDVTGKTREEAEAALRAQGVLGSLTIEENYLCEDPNVTEQRVCFTKPAAGQPTRAKIPAILYLRPKGTATYDMPDLRGKTADEAKQILMKLGQIPQRLAIEEMGIILDGCQAKRVCKQDPAPGTRTKESDYKRLDVSPAE